MLSLLLALIAKNIVPVAVGAGSALVIEHGLPWTVGVVKGFVGRNVSSIKSDAYKLEVKAHDLLIKAHLLKKEVGVPTAPPTPPTPPPAS